MFELLAHLLFLHWFGDFICQSLWMADNKSKNMLALTLHVFTYSFVLATGLASLHTINEILLGKSIFDLKALLPFIGMNFCLHWLTDITSSQFTKFFREKNDMYGFFATIGFDQYIHQMCLFYTAKVFLS